MRRIVECVPNFSEGRRPEVVLAIVQAIDSVDGVEVLNYSSDPDHNRSVVTFAGEPQAVSAGALAGIAQAAALIDLEQHEGVHPRLGATDVVPFVPLRNVTMAECAALARELGQRVGSELGLPVFMYEQAALRPERQRLEVVRRGGYEALKAGLGREARWQPDYGPAVVGKAGGVIIGARKILVAFNIFLDSADVRVAQAIAEKIRASGGGLPYLKAMGVLVQGRAQVSMNLTDFTQTPPQVVFDLVQREAAQQGVGIGRSEVIGLLPEYVLLEAGRRYLQLTEFPLGNTIEAQLKRAFDV